MYRQKISERPSYRISDVTSTPRKHDAKNYDKYIVSEWKLASYGLILSLIIIATKIYYLNRSYIHNAVFDKQLITLEELSNNGDVMFKNVWVEYVKYSKYWLPAFCGLLSTYFTWLMVYLDSNVPGVQPPSPLSPTKYKAQSGHIFHLNYIFALLIGVLVTAYMYWKGASL